MFVAAVNSLALGRSGSPFLGCIGQMSVGWHLRKASGRPLENGLRNFTKLSRCLKVQDYFPCWLLLDQQSLV